IWYKILSSAGACYPSVIPAQAGIQAALNWTPAFAGVTVILQLIYWTQHNYPLKAPRINRYGLAHHYDRRT
ncbi:MAG: hypothetical protein OET21_16450, partial [Desulfobacterales bacterium]|nr:hypothetical protein [Desulfobacterales bacterium]